MSKPVWIDCDTGVDDSMALILAHWLPEIDVVGISTVAGNVEVEKTCANTIRVLDLIGAAYPVYKGAEKPLVRKQVKADYVHGPSGLGAAKLPAPSREAEEAPAWDGLYAAAKAHAHELTLVCIGPLTNVATAFAVHPELPELLSRIVIMGGAVVGGNSTPCAEFNIFADPEAAESVFRSGVPMVMCGLDVTMQTGLAFSRIDELAATGKPAATFYQDATSTSRPFFHKLGYDECHQHDACAVMYAARPELFEGEVAGVFVETQGGITYGKTVCDLMTDFKFADRHVTVVTGVDREKFLATIEEALLAY